MDTVAASLGVGIVFVYLLSIVLWLGGLWLTVRVVRHAWKGGGELSFYKNKTFLKTIGIVGLLGAAITVTALAYHSQDQLLPMLVWGAWMGCVYHAIKGSS